MPNHYEIVHCRVSKRVFFEDGGLKNWIWSFWGINDVKGCFLQWLMGQIWGLS